MIHHLDIHNLSRLHQLSGDSHVFGAGGDIPRRVIVNQHTSRGRRDNCFPEYLARMYQRCWVRFLRGSRLVVVDGALNGRYGGAAALSFGPGGKRVAWVAGNTSSEQFVVVDGVESARRELIGSSGLHFSPSGKHVAYWAREKGRWLIVVDETESEERFDNIPRGSALVFDDDTRVHVLVVKNNRLVRIDVEIRE